MKLDLEVKRSINDIIKKRRLIREKKKNKIKILRKKERERDVKRLTDTLIKYIGLRSVSANPATPTSITPAPTTPAPATPTPATV